MKMNAVIATDGPASQFHHDRPRKSFSVRKAGPDVTPTAPRALWRMPLGSWNQLGPLMPTHDRISLTTPEAEKRNSHSTVIATDAVTEGK
jgi:hypothetical protein